MYGNYIGTDVSGTYSLNSQAGITSYADAFHFVTNNIIGGAAPGEGNLISGNLDYGISLQGLNTYSNRLEGNFIGTDATGTKPLPNGWGMFIQYSAHDNFVGGEDPAAGNVIAYNTLCGVQLEYDAWEGNVPYPVNNRILGNRIYANGGPSDASAFGILFQTPDFQWRAMPNDLCDIDVGPNNLQNYPVITSAISASTRTVVSGTLNSTPNTTFRIEFFANQQCSPSGYGQGERFLGATNVTTDGSCNAAFTTVLPVSVPAGQVITATATDPAGNTSEFSQCPSSPVVQDTTPPTLVGVPPDGTVQCDAVPAPAIVTATSLCGPAPVTFSEQRTDGTCPSNYTLKRTWSATDACGLSASQTQTVTVQDTTPPGISADAVSPATLWPPNHRLVLVTLDYTAADNCSTPACALSATSNEPDNGLGDGNTTDDIQLIPGDAHHLWLRAERSGTRHGRIYTITITATDACGNTASQRVTVTVPKAGAHGDQDPEGPGGQQERDGDGPEIQGRK